MKTTATATATIEKTAAVVKTREQSVEEQVLSAIGTIPGYLRTKVCPLFNNNFRVNVFAVTNYADSRIVDDIRIVHSFYISTDKAGNILTSSPKLPR